MIVYGSISLYTFLYYLDKWVSALFGPLRGSIDPDPLVVEDELGEDLVVVVHHDLPIGLPQLHHTVAEHGVEGPVEHVAPP